MTDKQCRDKLVGMLSCSWIQLEVEDELVRFLDKCLDQISWRSADQLPKFHTEAYEDDDESFEYEISDPVLAFTKERRMAVVKCCLDDGGKPCWVDDDGTLYRVTHWRPLPEEPKEDV